MGNIFCNENNEIQSISLKYYIDKYIENFDNLINVSNLYNEKLRSNRNTNNNINQQYNNMTDLRFKLGDAFIKENDSFFELLLESKKNENIHELLNKYKEIRTNMLKYGFENFISARETQNYIEILRNLHI